MRCLEIVLVIGFFLSAGQGAFGMQMQWDVRQSRKLLIQGGSPVTDKDKKLFIVKNGAVTMTGVALDKKLIAIPVPNVEKVKIGDKDIKAAGHSGGLSFFKHDDASSPFADYYTDSADPTGCEVYGFDGDKMVKVAAVISAYSQKVIELSAPKMCDNDEGAALVCSNKLAGIIWKGNGTGGDGGGAPAAGGGGAAAAGEEGGEKEGEKEGRGHEGKEAAPEGAAGGEAGTTAETTKTRRRRAEEGEKEGGEAGEGGGEAAAGGGGGGCSNAWGALSMKFVEEHAQKAGSPPTTYTTAMTLLPAAVAFGIVACLI